MSTTYWLISAPSNGGNTFSNLEAATRGLSQNFLVKLPALRSGTLDSLMTLSDDTAKHDQQVEAVLKKVERQLVDFGAPELRVKVDSMQGGLTPQQFVEEFQWAKNKYPERLSLVDINAKIHSEVMKIEEELRGKQTEYSQARSRLQTILRKQSGSLTVRSLSSLGLKQDDFVDTPSLVTVVVVLPKGDSKEWLSKYATILPKFENKAKQFNFYPVVPDSSKLVAEDDENAVFTCTLLRKLIDSFKHEVRNQYPRWVVREYEHNDDARKEEEDSINGAKESEEKLKSKFKTWLAAIYGEVFRAVLHLKIIRLFVESCLRYGVPPDFQVVLMKPSPKSERRLRDVLDKQFAHLGNSAMMGKFDDHVPMGMAGNQDFYSYVYFPLAVTSSQ